MAVAHYQFEAIHPFHDGNGRTGRILNILMLIEEDLLSEPVLSLSRFIIRHKTEYYRLLNAVTRNEAWEPWILYMLAAVEQTARSTLVKIVAIRDLQASIRDHARTVSRGGRDAEFLDLLFEQPYCRIAGVVERCRVSRPTATGWLNELVQAGILKDHRSGRDRLFVNHRFLDLLRRDEMTSTNGAD